MGFDKLLELIQAYARDYVFEALAVLSRPDAEDGEGSARSVLTPANPRTWVFCLISISLGSLTYTAAISRDLYTPNFEAFGALITLWLWILFAGVSHLTLKLLRGRGQFLDTLGVCLRVLPVAYMLSGFIALTVSLFARGATDAYPLWSRYAFLAAQFLILTIYLPPDLRRAHRAGLGTQFALTLALPAVVLGINVTLLSGVTRTPPTSGPPMVTVPGPSPTTGQIADLGMGSGPTEASAKAGGLTKVAVADGGANPPVAGPPAGAAGAMAVPAMAMEPKPANVPMLAMIDANKVPHPFLHVLPKDMIAVPLKKPVGHGALIAKLK